MTRARTRKPDRPIGERFVPLVASVLDSEAWRALSPVARALFVELRRLVHPKVPEGNNGKIHLSVREAADRLNVSPRTARKAFYELQAKGLIVVTELGVLGAEGHGKATTYRLTDCAALGHPRPTREYLNWKPDNDFRLEKGKPPATQRKRAAEVVPIRARPDA